MNNHGDHDPLEDILESEERPSTECEGVESITISDTTSIGPEPLSEPKNINGRNIAKNTWQWEKHDDQDLCETIGSIAICEHQAYHPPSTSPRSIKKGSTTPDRRYALLKNAMTKALREGGLEITDSCTFCLTDFVIDAFPEGIVLTFWKDLGGEIPHLDGECPYRAGGTDVVRELYESNVDDSSSDSDSTDDPETPVESRTDVSMPDKPTESR